MDHIAKHTKDIGKHLATIGTALLLVAAISASANAQTPTAGPPPPPAAAMPAARPPAPPAAPAKPAAPAPAAAPIKAAPAPAAPAPAAPKPAAELDQVKYLEGSWRCDGKQPAGPFGPEHAYKATFKLKKDVDSFWLFLDYEQKKSKVHPLPIKAKAFIGFDVVSKRFVTIGVDNTGGWVSETSTGWAGDKLVFAGEGAMMGQMVGFRETYTKKSDKEFLWLGEMKMGKDFIAVGSDDCKK